MSEHETGEGWANGDQARRQISQKIAARYTREVKRTGVHLHQLLLKLSGPIMSSYHLRYVLMWATISKPSHLLPHAEAPAGGVEDVA